MEMKDVKKKSTLLKYASNNYLIGLLTPVDIESRICSLFWLLTGISSTILPIAGIQ